MKSYSEIESLGSMSDYSEKDEYILQKIKILLIIFFITATILTLLVFGQALFTPKKDEYVKNLLYNNATLINDEWRFIFHETNMKIGNCEIFKNLTIENENFTGKFNKEFIRIGDGIILKKINLEGKRFTDCLSKYPRSINFQKLCLERLSLSLINDIANALMKQKEKKDIIVVAYCIPKDYHKSLDKIYLMEKVGKNAFTMKSNMLDYFINYPIEISNRYTSCKFFEYFIKTFSVFDGNRFGLKNNQLKNIKSIKEELDKICFQKEKVKI